MIERIGQSKGFALAAVALVLCFALPLYHWARFAAQSDLYSHVFLIPPISFYLAWLQRQRLERHSKPPRSWGVFLMVAGFIVLAGHWFAVGSRVTLTEEDSLALTTLSFLLLFYGICCSFWGKGTLRMVAFPLGFPIFAVPFPTFLHNGIESFFQYTSAPTADAMLTLAGTSFSREGLRFRLQGMLDFPIDVAPECSGLHASLVMFLTSLIASHLFLRTRWKQAVLVLAVVPLAILRNGFRIFIILQLCVHFGTGMLNSWIHRQGGPLFFALSLVPFFLLLAVLRKSDRVVKEMKLKHSGV